MCNGGAKQRRWLSFCCCCTSSEHLLVFCCCHQVNFTSMHKRSVSLHASVKHSLIYQIIFTINTFKIIVAEENCSLLHNIKCVLCYFRNCWLSKSIAQKALISWFCLLFFFSFYTHKICTQFAEKRKKNSTKFLSVVQANCEVDI